MKHCTRLTVLSAIVTTLTSLFLPMSHATEVNLGLAHQLFIVDHSGSMRGQYEWIGDAALELEASEGVATQFGLLEFSRNTRPIALNGSSFGNAKQFNGAVKQLKRGGGVEDGYLAIDEAISQYSVRNLFAPHIVLITDEHRTSVNQSVNANSLSFKMADAQIPVTVIVNVRFLCDDERMALGMDNQGMGIVLDADKALASCTIGKLIEPSERAHSVADYVDLALSSGGSAWDMNAPRSSEHGSAIFAHAFAQIHGAAVKDSVRSADTQPNISFSPDHPRVGDVVTFDASGSKPTREDVQINSWQWDFESDKQVDTRGTAVAHVFSEPGVYEVTLLLGTSASNEPVAHSFEISVEK